MDNISIYSMISSINFQPKELLGTISSNIVKEQLGNLSQLTFEVTDACNLKCKYCGYGELYNDHDERCMKYLNFERVKMLINYLTKIWESNYNNSRERTITLSFYGGEPLLNMKLVKQVVEYSKSVFIPGISFIYGMTTNAVLLHKHIDYLVEHQFKLLISLDGNKQNHSYRVFNNGKNSFDTVIQNIRFIKNKYPDYFNKWVKFNAVLHNRNSVEEVYEYVLGEFGKKPNISELNDIGIREDKKEQFLNTYRNMKESLDNSKNSKEISKDLFFSSPDIHNLSLFLHQYSGNVFRTYRDLLEEKDITSFIPTGTCLPFGRKMFMTVNNKILPCERIGHQFALGKVTEETVILDVDKIASYYNELYERIRNMCSSCFNQRACVKCVFNLDQLCGAPVCHGYMNKQVFIQYVEKQIAYMESNPEIYARIIKELVIN